MLGLQFSLTRNSFGGQRWAEGASISTEYAEDKKRLRICMLFETWEQSLPAELISKANPLLSQNLDNCQPCQCSGSSTPHGLAQPSSFRPHSNVTVPILTILQVLQNHIVFKLTLAKGMSLWYLCHNSSLKYLSGQHRVLFKHLTTPGSPAPLTKRAGASQYTRH